MDTAINYLPGRIEPEQEAQALHELCTYLVSKGKYRDESAAIKDAQQRVSFLEKNDVYADDPRLVNASWDLRATEALISAHNLETLLRENDGTLPAAVAAGGSTASAGVSGASGSSSPRPVAAGTADQVGRVRDRSTTDIYGSIEQDLRRGLSREQVITRLVDSGISPDNAADAHSFVVTQRKRKRRGKLIAGAAVIGLTVVFFFLSRFFI